MRVESACGDGADSVAEQEAVGEVERGVDITMGRRSGYGAGTFCWVNLSSPDPETAKRFYAVLLGWGYDDQPGGWSGFSMARRYDANVAASYRLEEQERAQGLPPHWNNYVNVGDADAAAAQAVELGGEVLDAPYDVTDAGRTAVLRDPTGAMFWVWQPRRHIGAGHVNDVGCLTWNDLNTDDPWRAIDFYSSLFGWSFQQMDTRGGPGYWVIGNDAAANGHNGGVCELSGDKASATPPVWLPYFTVASASAATETAATHGGSVRAGPLRAGAGTIAVVSDPAGAVFGLYEGEVDD